MNVSLVLPGLSYHPASSVLLRFSQGVENSCQNSSGSRFDTDSLSGLARTLPGIVHQHRAAPPFDLTCK